MRRSSSRAMVLALAATFFAVPATLSAQVHFLMAGGISAPSGSFGNALGSGYHGRIGLQIGAPLFPLSARVEADVNRFPAKGGASGHATVADGTASAVLSLGGIGISPYVLGGLGEYHTSFGGGMVAPTSTDVGYHVGAGLSVGLLGFGGFLEARFVDVHAKYGDVRYFPITVGLRF